MSGRLIFFYKHTDDRVPFDASCRGESSLCDGKGILNYNFDGSYNWKVNDPEFDV